MKGSIAVACVFAAACGSDTEPGPGGPPPDADDPLAVTTAPPAGSLDDLHQRVIAKRCSGQPGLCHNGQFEPNLSTPGLTYAYLVDRPGIEKPDRLRVMPGDASRSLFIDKIRNRNGVATQMPLGAESLAEADIAALEKWINDGALRAPGAAPAPKLNNPPRRPQIGVFNAGGARLDTGGMVTVAAGTALVLRHTAADFETADAQIPFAAFILQVEDETERKLVLGAGDDPSLGLATFDAGGPPAAGDVFNFRRNVTIGANVELIDEAGDRETVPSAGLSFTIIAVYVDAADQGILAAEFRFNGIRIQ